MNRKTVKLLAERLVGHNHLPAGTRVTLGDREADALIKQGHAVVVPYDEDARIPPPRKREMIRTAAVDPSPRKAAKIAGQSN